MNKNITYKFGDKKFNWHSYQSITREDYAKLKKEGLDTVIYQQIIDSNESPGIYQFQEAIVCHVDLPLQKQNDSIIHTYPFSIYLKDDLIISFTHENYDIEKSLDLSVIESLKTPFDFVLYLLEIVILSYLPLLKQVRERSQENDHIIRRDMSNDSLYKMLDLQKTLVYFISSINLNDTVIELIKNRYQDELEDYQNKKITVLLIESKQIMTMSSLYQEIVDTTSNVLSSIINNNVNDIMKVMTIWTVIQNSAMIISGIYGMNVDGMPFSDFAPAMIVTGILCIVTWFALKKRL